jgi:GNAT superfamily N-acetyltransferase
MIRIRAMTEGDIPLGMRLTAQAGWNQTEADWRRFLHLAPNGCFVAEWDGVAVGTTAVFRYLFVTWVAMVLVDEAVRGRGIGAALMRHALAFADGWKAKCLRLDATPLGRPIYEKLGFVAEYSVVRYGGLLPEAYPSVPGVEPVTWSAPADALTSSEVTGVLNVDLEGTSASRYPMVIRMFEEAWDRIRVVKGAEKRCDFRGYLASRPGSNAVQIGPCIATDGEAGRLLLADAAHRHAGQSVFIDVPAPNLAAVRAVEALGLRPQRELLRMVRGEPVRERVEWLWASSGPEKG